MQGGHMGDRRARARTGTGATRATRAGAIALAVGMVAAGVLTIGTASPASAADPQVPVSMIVTERPVYDRYEPVVIDGVIGFFPSCPTGGVRDFIYPWADVYVVAGPSAAIGSLSDVNGAPNTVGGSGGGVFGEVIGYAGVNSLTSGVYTIVVDECQDGKLDYNDTVFPSAFRVTTKTSVAPMTGIAGLKSGAQTMADHWKARGRDWKVLLAINEVLGYASAFVANPPMVAIGIGVSSFISTQVKGAATGIFPDPKAIVATHNTNMARHYEGIAKDPPDPAFAQPTTVAPTTLAAPVHEGALFDQAAALLAAGGAEAGLAEALLRSIERYQGADAAGDGTWALVHARQAQGFAALLADQLRASAPAFEAAASALEADPSDLEDVAHDLGAAIDGIFASGLDAEQQAALARSGVTRSQLAAELSGLAALGLGTWDRAASAATLRAIASDGADFADDLDVFVASVEPLVDSLEADPFAPDLVPTAHAGGPYSAAVGTPVSVRATASTPGAAPLATFEWDLDGDGAFDDATGATTSGDPGQARTGWVGVRVTDAAGYQGIAYAPITVTGGSFPSATTSLPADDGPTVEVGGSLPMAFSAAGGTTRWRVDGVEVATGPTFAFNPAAGDLGARQVRAEVLTRPGVGVARDWTVTVTGPDDDGDGYSTLAPDAAQQDCNDVDAAVHPGAPELLDGKDNDCNPSSPDGGVAPVADAGDPIAGPEGGAVALLDARFTTVGATGPYTARVDWGDGSSSSATIASTGNRVNATHAYADDGTYPVEVCVRSSTGLVDCAQTEATITNEAATPLFVSLFGWTAEHYLTGGQGAPLWTVAPDGQSVFQSRNSNPSLFVSDQPLIGTEAQVTIGVETTGDDDFIGFALGTTPGVVTDPDARYLLVDWKQNNQGDSCGTAPRGLALSYVWGVPHSTELWAHKNCQPGPGGVTELARATNLGSTAWADNDSYQFRFAYTTTSLQVWVDEVLELDVDLDTLLPDGVTTVGDVVGESFPIGNLAFFNHSQSHVRYSGYQLSGLSALEGIPRAVVAEFEDPGTTDTHTGRFDFGDGTPEEAAVIDEVDGAGTATATHTYAQEGQFPGELCLTDDEGAVGCQQVLVTVANVPPTVDAGPDLVGGPAVTIDKATFQDPGRLDTHTATVDWGDGSAVEDLGAVPSTLGLGNVAAAHTFPGPGTYEVELCVTDDAGDTGCDTLQVAIAGPTAPQVETVESLMVLEGDEVEGGVAYVDLNTSDDHDVSVDWGDGTVEPAVVQAKGGQGAGLLVHRYADDGTFVPTFTVCDEDDLCGTARIVVTVANAAPTVTPSTDGPHLAGEAVALAAPFTDPGSADTHTATVDWGDGSSVESLTVARRTATGRHAYSGAGERTITVCVLDDDGGEGCATTMVSVTGVDQPTPTTDPPTPTTEPPTPVGSTTVPAAPTTTVQVAAGTLPRTGTNGLPTRAAAGAALVLLGAVLLCAEWRKRPIRR